ncbi:MAG: ADP-ribosylglycohydrolase family protein [Chloroflexi bacterium]|nr:ADP-ribosylglycohydrolase family protein [Chloroflexota bacterium]
MIGAIAGDIIGSVYEWHNIKTTYFPLFKQGCKFTDDSVLTIALADSILNQADYIDRMKFYFHKYPFAGFGGHFSNWAESDSREPYNSWGNGAAMRISPVGFAYKTLEETLEKAEYFTALTHNHPEGIKGGCATAAAIFLGREGRSKIEIKDYIETNFKYDLSRSLERIRPTYHYDISCQGTVPEALIAFLESNDFEDAIRKAVSLGGDCDTLTCITGGIAQGFYGEIPQSVAQTVYELLDEPLRLITQEFSRRYCETNSPT